MNNKMVKGLLVFCVANNHAFMPDEFFWSYLRMFKPRGSFAVKGSASIKSSSINEGIYKALELGAEWLFLMDVDQTFPRDTIPRLFKTATKHNADIVSVLYHIGNAPYSPVAGWLKKEKDDVVSVNANGEFWKTEYAPLGKGVVEVDWVGAGGVLIHRRVLDALEWPPFKDEWKKGRGVRSFGHDISFCRRAKEKGFKVVVDTDICSDHGKFIYLTKEYADAFNETKMAEKMGDSLRDQTFESGYWDVVWESDEIRNVARCNKKTFDDIVKVVPEGSSVGDFGCGPGVLMEFLKDKKKCSCFGYDFSETAIEIIKKSGFDGKVMDFRNFDVNRDGRKYDVVVSANTIEHIDKDITFLQNLKKMCKPGGKVVISTPSHDELKGNLEHIRGYNDDTVKELMGSTFKKYDVQNNSRDYILVGYND